MSILNDDMLTFLNENSTDRVITKIIGCTIKDWDDDIGFIGQHYIVKCEIKGSGLDVHKCYVKMRPFNDFRTKTKLIIWENG